MRKNCEADAKAKAKADAEAKRANNLARIGNSIERERER